MMKLTLVIVACLICAIAVGQASPTEKSSSTVKPAVTASKDVREAIKNAKEAKKAKKECLKPCTEIYEPVCAHDPADASYKPRTFGSQCTLDAHNCEAGTKLIAKSKGECPGSGGVRL